MYDVHTLYTSLGLYLFARCVALVWMWMGLLLLMTLMIRLVFYSHDGR